LLLRNAFRNIGAGYVFQLADFKSALLLMVAIPDSKRFHVNVQIFLFNVNLRTWGTV